MRAIGGTLYIVGVWLMAYNLWTDGARGPVCARRPRCRRFLEKARRPLTHGKLAFSHRWLEGKPMFFTACALVAVLVGGMIEIIPDDS
jgi:cytochrome c oxidase cbb3-type subunit I/II